tara:strand:+ start:514 stop:1260 length:747 start_codon:yes stop_codon:yes gene_type:complete
MENIAEILPFFALALAGVLGGFINITAGGGSLIAIPALLLMGLPENVANGTLRIAILVQVAVACAKYLHAGRVPLKPLRTILPLSLVGALYGAYIATQISNAAFKPVLSLVIIGSALVVALRPSSTGKRIALPNILLWPALFAVGFYGGFIQISVGYLILFALILCAGQDLVQANIYKPFVVLTYTPFALFIFAKQGLVVWEYGLCLALGQGLGGYIAATANLKYGEKIIRPILLAVALFSLGLIVLR